MAAHIAKCPECGRVVAAVSDPHHAVDAAKVVSRWVREGYLISHMTTEEIRAADWGHASKCLFGDAAKKSRKLFAADAAKGGRS